MDDVYVLACPKSELTYDEEAEKKREKERKREQLSVVLPLLSDVGDRRERVAHAERTVGAAG